MKNFMKQWADLSKTTMMSSQKIADISSELMMNLTQQQMDMVGIYLDSGNKQVQAFGQVKRLGDVYTAQSQLLEEFNKRVFNNARVTVEMLMESKKQLTEWVQESFKQSSEFNPMTKVVMAAGAAIK